MVTVRTEQTVIPTYEPQAPDPNPMFLEKRVYQGSSGRVYPLPFIDRIAETKTDRRWTAVYLENEYLEVMILPEIGGRIHAVRDKTNGYDIFYRQDVIKPALVGLAGPWISGGVEFNWPQHHRPATFMPVEFEIEKDDDGSVTVWMGDHDPMARMRGLHGVRVRPGSSVVELRVRVYNRTPDTQTFLWWANVAARADENYRSFFPPDVHYVADHAKRSMSAFPLCEDRYYGVPYGERADSGVPAAEIPPKFAPPGAYAANDLSWYANIPVPTSYMCMGTKDDFFGGYDYGRKAGFIHFADHRIAPGKKQWTWGNHEFGYAWDRLLSDDGAPYIELMAGVYTDNQPDFSFLQPGETKTWSQYWYPIRDIGVSHKATLDAALSLEVQNGVARIGVSVTSPHPQAGITLFLKDAPLFSAVESLSPEKAYVGTVKLPSGAKITGLTLVVTAGDGRVLASYSPVALQPGDVPPPATEPPAPEEIKGNDELFTTGLHLDQYRHATRMPTPYWLEALRRDPQDSRCNTAMGKWHLRRGELALAEKFLRTALDRLTRRNPNPADGEAYYQLGRTLLLSGRTDEAYDAFYKACWNREWQAAGYHMIAEVDCLRGDYHTARDHLARTLCVGADNLRARNLLAMVLRKLGRDAAPVLRETLALDPLDSWAKWLSGDRLACDAHACLDLAHDLARAGFFDEADAVLEEAKSRPGLGAAPLIGYTRGWIASRHGDAAAAKICFNTASKTDATYCFPAREEDMLVLEAAMKADPKDALSPYLAGNWLYDRRRHEEAIVCFGKAVKLDPKNAIAWRNLGIGWFNIRKNPAKARAAYAKACAANPDDARLFYERDQLRKRTGESPKIRLKEFEKNAALITKRDDLTVEYGELLNQAGRHTDALVVVSSRKFQPWEGGEGKALGLHARTHRALGIAALNKGEAATATAILEAALACPGTLGEARHLLANASDLHYLIGLAAQVAGDRENSKHHLTLAADFRGDFRDMSVVEYSDMTVYSAMALELLGKKAAAKKLLNGLLAHARQLAKTPAKIDYFATSLPTMLLFDEDLQARRVQEARFLEAQAQLGLGKRAIAKRILTELLVRDPNHAGAADLLATL